MKKEKSIKKNYFYNLAYQLLLIIVPLISTPYLSRVLGKDNTGIFGYTLSITTYFVLLGGLGINLYGQKEIAYVQDKKKEKSVNFIEIFLLKALFLSLSIIVYAVLFFKNEYGIYFKILTIELISNLFDITWFFQGIEDFKKTVIRNFFVKLTSLILIFVFVKNRDDLFVYFLIYTITNLIGNLSLWFYLPSFIDLKNIKKIKIFKHLKPAIALFIPQIAIQIYTVLDKTMLGILSPDIGEVGYYEYGQKIVNVLLIVVTSLGTVMLPRISNLFAKKDFKKMKEYIMLSFNIIIAAAMPIIFGVIATSNSFVILFLGNEYDKSVLIVDILVSIVLFIGITNIIGCQLLLPAKKNKEYTIAACCGAIVNFISNYLLIPKFGCIGASIGTFAAEFSVLLAQFFLLKKELNIKFVIKNIAKYSLFSFVMLCSIVWIQFFIESKIICLIIQISVGALVYGILLYVFKDNLLNIIFKQGGLNEKDYE